MSHDHSHNTTSGIKLAFFLNLAFAIFEVIGALYTNSLSILSSGLHDLGDSFSLGLSWYLNRAAQKQKTSHFSYGFKRLSLVAAFLNSLIIMGGSFYILSEAFPRLMNPEPSNAQGMFIFASIGLVINGIAYIRLKRGKTLSEEVAALHLLDDVLSLSAILIISVIIQFQDIPVLDPVLSILITVYVLSNVVKNMRKTVNIFLQAVPDNMNARDIESELKTIQHVHSVHDTHIWSLDGEHHILTTHLVVSNDCSKEQVTDIKCHAKKLLQAKNIYHSTVEMEHVGEHCKIQD